jgi:hypothetical protein
MKPLPNAAVLTQEATMESVLRAAGAHAWTPQMIDTHKLAELAKAPRPGLLYHILPVYQFVFGVAMFTFLGFAVMTIGMALIVACAWAGSMLNLWGTPQMIYDTALICTVITTLSAIATLCFWHFEQREILEPAKWVRMDLDFPDHCVPVPIEARVIARSARMFKPGVRATLHALIQNKVILDPILEIDGHYVLVWDEKGTIILPH